MKKIIFLTLIACFFSMTAFAGKIIDRSNKGYLYLIPKKSIEDESISVLITFPGMYIKAKQDINNWAFAANKNKLLLITLDVNYNSITTPKDLNTVVFRINTIISDLQKEHRFSIKKINIAGTSAGGMLSMRLALSNPGKFNAIGVISGARLAHYKNDNLKTTINNSQSQRFYILHGSKDKVIKINEARKVKRILEKNSAIIKYEEITNGQHTLGSSEYRKIVDWLANN